MTLLDFPERIKPNRLVAVAGPDCGGVTTLDYVPDTRSGFLMFQGKLREVREIHETNSGVQIELY